MLSVSGRLMRMAMTGLGLLQLCLLLAIFQAEILPTINIIDVGTLNIYLSPIKMRKALNNCFCFDGFPFLLHKKHDNFNSG